MSNVQSLALKASPVVAFSPHPLLLAKERELECAPFLPQETIAAYLARTGIAARMGRQPFRLKLDGRQLPRALWAQCRPNPGTLIAAECERDSVRIFAAGALS